MSGPQVPPGLGAPTPSDDAAQLFDQPWCAPITSNERVYAGAVWNIRRETFDYGNGELRRDFMDHTGAVAVVAIDEQDRILVLRQYRHPVRLREWELPAGLLDVAAEPALTGAQRELAEEADLVASDWQVLVDYCTSPGGSNEIVRVYLARGLSSTDAPHERTGEEADMELRWVSLDDAHEAVLMGRVTNSITMVAVLTAMAKRTAGWAHLLPGNASWPMLEWRNASA
jgi:ADP-ribose pyrophosphatase